MTKYILILLSILTCWACDDSSVTREVSHNLGDGGSSSGGYIRPDVVDLVDFSSGGSTGGGESTGGVESNGGMVNAECVEGDTQCAGIGLLTCSEGAWTPDTTCPYVCSEGACTGECVPGSTKCDGQGVMVCSEKGLWELNQTCPSVCSEGSSGASCSGVCVPGAKQCSSASQAQTCSSSGLWVDSATCSSVCSSGECVGSCVPGSLTCTGKNIQFCSSSGTWTYKSSCNYVCTSGACTGVCTPGEVDCNGLTPRTCNPLGVWESGSTCPYTCSAGACSGVCTPGTKRCSGSGTQECNSSGNWSTAVACPSSTNQVASCTGAGTCKVDCVSGYADCDTAASNGCEASLTSTTTCGSCSSACVAFPTNAAPICTTSGCDIVCNSGWANADGLNTNGCEMDISTDPLNCGAPGNSCYGGACKSGVCEFDVSVVSSWSKADYGLAVDLAVTPTEIYVQTGTGYILQISKSTGIVTVIANGYVPAIVYDADGTFVSDRSLQVVDGYLIWVGSGNTPPTGVANPKGIYTYNLTTKVLKKLSSDAPAHLEVVASTLYWNSEGRVLCVASCTDTYGCHTCDSKTTFSAIPVTGGTLKTWVTDMDSISKIQVVGDYMYMVQYGRGGILKFDMTASTVVKSGVTDSPPAEPVYDFDIAEGYVHVSGSGYWKRVAFGSAYSTTITNSLATNCAIIWSTGANSALCVTKTGLKSLAVSGLVTTSTNLIPEGGSLGAITNYDQEVYWSVLSSSGTQMIYKAPLP